jgi:hypothetical protein
VSAPRPGKVCRHAGQDNASRGHRVRSDHGIAPGGLKMAGVVEASDSFSLLTMGPGFFATDTCRGLMQPY